MLTDPAATAPAPLRLFLTAMQRSRCVRPGPAPHGFSLRPRSSPPSPPRPRGAKPRRRRRPPARCRRHRPIGRRRNGAATSTPTASNTAPTRPMPASPCAMPRRCAPPASAPRPSPCCSGCRWSIPTTRRSSANTAAPWPMPATTSRRSMCSAAPIRPISPTGASCRPKAPSSTNWAVMRKRRATTRPHSRSCPTSRPCCPIWDCPTRCRKTCRMPRRRCGARRPIARSTPGCGRTSPWSSACRAASPKPSKSPAPTCRPSRPRPMSPICAKCWRAAMFRRPRIRAAPRSAARAKPPGSGSPLAQQ